VKKRLMRFLFVFSISMIEALMAAQQENKLWSILICTLEERKVVFAKLYQKLQQQVETNGLQDQVEIVYFCDKREHSVGFKRNYLLHNCSGKYISYVDDDDDIHDAYVPLIYEQLLKDPDCVSLKGIITFDGKNKKYFIHSIKYNSWFEADNIYFRPPNHLNPIRKSIAIQFAFPDKYVGEDSDWSMQIVRSELLTVEAEVAEPYYFYKYVTKKKQPKKR
jgi:glycosyltransferase involved in cell wall biosynthesis